MKTSDWQEAHRLLKKYNQELMVEARSLQPGWFGPSKREIEVFAAINTLTELGWRMVNEAKRQLK